MMAQANQPRPKEDVYKPLVFENQLRKPQSRSSMNQAAPLPLPLSQQQNAYGSQVPQP